MYSNTYDDTLNPSGTTTSSTDGIRGHSRRYPRLPSQAFNSRASGRSSSSVGSLSSGASSFQPLQPGVSQGAGGGDVEAKGGRGGCGGCGCGCGCVTKGCCWRGVLVVLGLCILGSMVALLTVYILFERMKASARGCVEGYMVLEERSAWGGVDMGWQSVSSCKRLCENSEITCYGVDYSTDGICWLHRRTYNLNPGKSPGVKNYRRQFNCDPEILCVEKYSTTRDRQAEGGVLIESASSVPACKLYCESSYTCSGFDHKNEFGKGKCWIHRSGSSLTLSSQPAPGFTNYRRLFNCLRDSTRFTTSPAFITTRRHK